MAPDYSTWVTKQAAADTIGVSTKTVEQLATDGQLEAAFYRRPSGGARRRVYNPDDVARLAEARRTAPSAFVLPAGAADSPGSATDPGQALASVPAPPLELAPVFTVLDALLRRFSEVSGTLRPATLFVDLDEASAISGLPVPCLRRFIRDGALKVVRSRRLLVRRRDLETL